VCSIVHAEYKPGGPSQGTLSGKWTSALMQGRTHVDLISTSMHITKVQTQGKIRPIKSWACCKWPMVWFQLMQDVHSMNVALQKCCPISFWEDPIAANAGVRPWKSTLPSLACSHYLFFLRILQCIVSPQL